MAECQPSEAKQACCFVDEPYLLTVARRRPLLQLLLCTLVLENSFVNQDGFDGGVTEDDSRSEEAIYHGDDDLDYIRE